MRILFICSCILFYSSFVYANECSGENAKLIEQLETKLDNCKIEMPDNATDVEMINAYDNLTNCTKDVAYQIFDSFYKSKNQSVKNDFNKVIKATYLHYQNLIKNSDLAQKAQVCLPTGSPAEVCPLGLTPTTSTTVMTVIGDILVVGTMERIGFTNTEYAKRHHGGYLGDKSRKQSEGEIR